MKNLSTSNWNLFRNYTVERIRAASVLWEPYWHVEVQDILHPELFALTQSCWPDYDNTSMVTDNSLFEHLSPHRRYTYTNRHDLNGWVDFYNNIQNHPDIVDAVWSFEQLHLPNCISVDSSLWEDYRGYEFENHVDKSDIGIAWHIYVYCSGEGQNYGTSLNLPDGTKVKTFPFKPNFCYFNRVDAMAWHSIDPVDADLRRSVMTRFNVRRDGLSLED